jgi:hypothetical protein
MSTHRPLLQSLTPPFQPVALAAAAALALAACSADQPSTQASDVSAVSTTDAARAGDAPGTHRQYGVPQQLGDGRARTYVVLDERGNPLEVGVAFDERAMDGLPAPMAHDGGMPGGHADMHEYLLQLPAQNPTPFKFVELDWNPAGHEPAGIYDKPHFDFHFYTIDVAARNAIDPTSPAYAAQAASFPAPAYVLPGYVPPTALVPGAPAAALAVPRMGLHWLNPQSPELPPTMAPFTRTFIQGSWDGKVIFLEPMITRAYIMSKPTETLTIPVAQHYEPAGWYPSSYRVRYDEQAKEYRIALGGMGWRN